jgi:SHS2 domain-containing protein
MQNTDRNPIDPTAIAEATAALTCAVHHGAGAEAFEAASKRLLDALLEQGCLRLEEHAEAWIEASDGYSFAIEWGGELNLIASCNGTVQCSAIEY